MTGVLSADTDIALAPNFEKFLGVLNIECIHQNLVDMIDEDHFELLQNLFWNFLQIFLILAGADNGTDATAMSRKNLLLQATNPQYTTAKGNLASHSDG